MKADDPRKIRPCKNFKASMVFHSKPIQSCFTFEEAIPHGLRVIVLLTVANSWMDSLVNTEHAGNCTEYRKTRSQGEEFVRRALSPAEGYHRRRDAELRSKTLLRWDQSGRRNYRISDGGLKWRFAGMRLTIGHVASLEASMSFSCKVRWRIDSSMVSPSTFLGPGPRLTEVFRTLYVCSAKPGWTRSSTWNTEQISLVERGSQLKLARPIHDPNLAESRCPPG